jgi:hypothetical protein
LLMRLCFPFFVSVFRFFHSVSVLHHRRGVSSVCLFHCEVVDGVGDGGAVGVLVTVVV